EEPQLDDKIEFDRKIEEFSEDLGELELPASMEKTNDPVRMYLREMGSVPLLTRAGEVEIARRIERGQNAVLKALSRCTVVVQAAVQIGEAVRNGQCQLRDVIQVGDEEPL